MFLSFFIGLLGVIKALETGGILVSWHSASNDTEMMSDHTGSIRNALKLLGARGGWKDVLFFYFVICER